MVGLGGLRLPQLNVKEIMINGLRYQKKSKE